MNRPMGETRLSLHARLWLLASLAVVVLPHLPRLPVLLGAFCVGALLWRLLRELRGWRLPGKGTTLVLTLLAVGTVIGIHGTVVGHEAGAAMLVVMLSLKLIEVKSLRDGMIVVMLGYFVVVSGFLFEQTIFAGVYLFGVTALLTATLVALNHPGEGSRWREYLRLSGALLIQALPLMLALFFLFPRLSGGLWGVAAGNQAITGLGEELEMGAISQLMESEEVAFRAEFPQGSPPAETLYWRGPVLWHTDGRRWTGLTRRERALVPTQSYTPAPIGEPLPYAVTLEPHQRHWLLALDFAAKTPPGASIAPGGQLVSDRKVRTRRRVAMEAFPGLENPPLTGALSQWALALPAGHNPKTVAMAEAWRAEGLGDRALVARALSHFRDGPFIYTLNPPKLVGDPVDEFLFGTKRGFCEHYAASFVTLMRASGVPARLVTGYYGGDRNDIGEFLVVRQSNAHAWTEVYLQGEGWVRIDPTAVIPPERVENGARAAGSDGTGQAESRAQESWINRGWQLAAQGWDALNHHWNVWVMGYDSSQQRELLERLGLGGLGWGGLVALLAGSLGLGMAVAALFILRRHRKRDPLGRAWQRFGQKLAQVGTARLLHEGPRDFGRRAAERHPGFRAQIDTIVNLYERLRYGPEPDNAGDLEKLEHAVRKFRPRQ